MNSKKFVLGFYPTACVRKVGEGYVLEGVFDTFKVSAPTEAELWRATEAYAQQHHAAFHRYCVMANHMRWIKRSKKEVNSCRT